MSPNHLHIEELATLDSNNNENECENELGCHISEKREMNDAGKLSGLFSTK